MDDRKLVAGLLVLSAGLALAACSATQAEPLQVTYYYLPG